MTTQNIIAEYAEKIVIEYANISGRADNRAAVREAAKKVLGGLIEQVREEHRNEIIGFIEQESGKSGRKEIIDFINNNLK